MDVLLTSSPVSIAADFAIVAPGYPAPVGVPVMTMEEALAAPGKLRGTMLVVGLSRLLTPSNRVVYGQVLLRPWQGLRRISVDDRLFWADPWRMWWHFFSVGKERWGFTDSFLAESRWHSALELQAEDPFGVPKVLEAMRGVVDVAPDAFRFQPIKVDFREVSDQVREEYAAEKEEAFTHEKTLSAILKRLTAVAQHALPERCVPTPSRLFERPPRTIVCTDLAVDRFLVERLVHLVELTNAIAGGAR